MKIKRLLGVVVVAAMVFAFSSMAVSKELLFGDYNAVEVKAFKVPSYVPAPDMSGDELAENIVYQVRRYAQKYGVFDIIIKEGTAEVPADKRTLLVRGEVTEYTHPTVGGEISRRIVPFGEHTGSAYFAAHYQFVDKETGEVLYETDLRTSSTGSNNTVDYAMLRNAEAAAKVMYRLEK
jgi:hypothetical protein